MKAVFLLPFVLLFCVQCMNFQDVRNRRAEPEVRDLPSQVRGDDETINLRRRVIVLPFLNLSPYSSASAGEIARSTLVAQLVGTREILTLSNNDLPQDISKFQTCLL